MFDVTEVLVDEAPDVTCMMEKLHVGVVVQHSTQGFGVRCIGVYRPRNQDHDLESKKHIRTWTGRAWY